ncbi:MAG: DEAD/DEAH box helicase, partial [Sphingobacteriales bacterium]
MDQTKTKGYKKIKQWLKANGRKPFKFQEDAWQNYLDGYSGLVNAPTGFGKTFSLFLAIAIEALNASELSNKKAKDRLQLIWITPLRSLAKDIARAMRETLTELELDWHVGVRN